MSARATSKDPTGAADGAAVDTGYLGRVLEILIHIAAAIVDTVALRTQAGPAPVFLDGAAVYLRVVRAVRRMIMLAMKIDAPGYGDSVEAPTKRDRVACKSETVMPRPARDGMAGTRPGPVDRLDIPYTLKNKTMDQLIREICRDLGLPALDGTYHWESLTPWRSRRSSRMPRRFC